MRRSSGVVPHVTAIEPPASGGMPVATRSWSKATAAGSDPLAVESNGLVAPGARARGYTTCVSWSGPPFNNGDIECLAGADETVGPGALIRGGALADAAGAGPLAVSQLDPSSSSDPRVGFRCARAL